MSNQPPRGPRHEIENLSRFEENPTLGSNQFDAWTWGSYESFLVSAKLDFCLWSASLRMGAEIKNPVFLNGELLTTTTFRPELTLREDGCCSVRFEDKTQHFLPTSFRSLRMQATPEPSSSPVCASINLFDRSHREEFGIPAIISTQEGLLQHMAFANIDYPEFERIDPKKWTVARGSDGLHLAGVGREAFVERLLSSAKRRIFETIQSLGEIKHPNIERCDQNLRSADGNIYNVIEDEDGPKYSIADLSGLIFSRIKRSGSIGSNMWMTCGFLQTPCTSPPWVVEMDTA